jgi:hypothetical protein
MVKKNGPHSHLYVKHLGMFLFKVQLLRVARAKQPFYTKSVVQHNI